MKNIIKISTILLLLFCVYSCETEDIVIQNTVSESFSRKSGVVTEQSSESIDLENKMQWVSYMTAQILLNKIDARDDFNDVVVNLGGLNSFPLSTLLEAEYGSEAFIQAFRDEFFLNYNIGNGANDPCNGVGRPDGRPLPTGTLGGMPDDAIFSAYISTLLEDDCLEFYLPNGYAPIGGVGGGPSAIKSTAHPLTNAISNDGFNHDSACFVSTMTINDNTPGIAIVVRPFRNTTNCTYYDYLINFVDFLD